MTATYPTSVLKSYHRYASDHRHLLKDSHKCACFYCLARFDYDTIDRYGWTDNESTALCPICGIDAVLPSGGHHYVDDDLLAAMKAYWFGELI